MPLPTGDVIGILADNLRLRRSVLTDLQQGATRWARGSGSAPGGETVLYTGMMYQLIPYIEGLVKAEKTSGRFLALQAHGTRPHGQPADQYEQRSWLAVRRGCGPSTIRSPSMWPACSGKPASSSAICMRTTFTRARWPTTSAPTRWSRARSTGVRDLQEARGQERHHYRSSHHQHAALACTRLLAGYDVQVRSYLEVLAEKGLAPKAALTGEVAFHDSCVFARSENMVREPRELLEKAGVTVREPENTGKLPGAAAARWSPSIPRKPRPTPRKRVAQLRKAAPDGRDDVPHVLRQPQRRAPMATCGSKDISHYLRQAYAP